MDISDIRKEYETAGLVREDLQDDPNAQFERWFKDAMDAGVEYPNGLSLATVGSDGVPSIRTVLLKMFDQRGYVFYTNFNSQKAGEIEQNPNVALLFPWLDLQRQVKIIGTATKVSTAESLQYFATRPRGSQLGAWCSPQSQTISSRSILESAFARMAEKFAEGKIPVPDFWGGYRVEARQFEFWQGRVNRLHDRFLYTRGADDKWQIRRLAP